MWTGASVVSFGVVACVLLLPAKPNPSAHPVVGPLADPAGTFEGRTPCGEIANGFTGFPAGNCEKIKWELVLNTDSSTGAPTTFVYRGTRTTREGRWSVQRGTPFDGNAVVYRLQPATPHAALELLAIDGGVLLLLDADRRVMVGDASWSYALNRTAGVTLESARRLTPR